MSKVWFNHILIAKKSITASILKLKAISLRNYH
jgi:hypothetical protein